MLSAFLLHELVNSSVLETSHGADSLHKELLKELQKAQKKDINRAVLKNLQKLSFSSRRHNIEETSGPKVVNQILEKFPFLDNERILWSVLELLVSQELPKEDVTVEKFLEHWPQIAKCFLDEEIDQGWK